MLYGAHYWLHVHPAETVAVLDSVAHRRLVVNLQLRERQCPFQLVLLR